MNLNKFSIAFNNIRELFEELAEGGKLTAEQVTLFNNQQKAIVGFYNDVKKIFDHPVELPWQDEDFAESWASWKLYKKQQFRFTYKSIAEKDALERLKRISKNNKETAKKILREARECGWEGFFELKGTYKKTNKKASKNIDDIDNINF